jgi:hypothetical protein
MTTSKVTTDHDEIRRWVESRGGQPAAVKSTDKPHQPGILRVDFPGFSGEDSLEPVAWDDWFKKFDASGLAFVYQEHTADGKPSRFNKLVSRDTASTKRSRTGS